MGVVQYHTWMLTKNGEVEECRSGRYRRFFGAGKYKEEERLIISLLRQGTAGRILEALAGNGPLAHMTLARALGVSSQALTWHMKRLRSTGMVETGVSKGELRLTYRLADGVAQMVQASSTPIPGLVQAPVLH